MRPKSSVGVWIEDVALYLGEVTMASLEGESAKGAALRDHRERQRCFLRRAAEPEGPATWRPRKRHGKAAYQVAAHI